ncbi:hypothetical protein [Xanthomarina sp. F2636L]|uniref:hypothetical protein n=1 Tax=Xanthomarina sp. F2636L TaxID=2996018 RepID=UPI00225E4F01|nr:hypothetical protein [Xanthomarina sp. F2636L]MCX7551741.1 hypothetical protein [Xanthomarina sp. F2636L]
MNTQLEYKSFNREKSIDELQYTMNSQIEKLQILKEELHFLQFLMSADIYKNKIMNLFEDLERYKKELNNYSSKCGKLIIDANFQANQIRNKKKCDELACDNYFIDTYNESEKKIHKLINQIRILKLEIYNFLPAVIKTE